MGREIDIIGGGMGRRRGSRGASIVIALVFLLVCAVIASVIVGSASANAERSTQHADEEQAYFALASAVEEAKAMFSTTPPVDSIELSAQSSDSSSVTASPEDYASTEISNWAISEARYVFEHKGSQSDGDASLTVVVSATNPHTGEALPDVRLTYSMDRCYAITVDAVLEDRTDYEYEVTTKVPATTSGSAVDASGTVTYGYPFIVTWNAATGATSS